MANGVLAPPFRPSWSSHDREGQFFTRAQLLCAAWRTSWSYFVRPATADHRQHRRHQRHLQKPLPKRRRPAPPKYAANTSYRDRWDAAHTVGAALSAIAFLTLLVAALADSSVVGAANVFGGGSSPPRVGRADTLDTAGRTSASPATRAGVE